MPYSYYNHYSSRSQDSGVRGQQNVASTEIGAPGSLCAPERPSEISVPTDSCFVGYQPGIRGGKFHNNIVLMVKLDVRKER